jgi:phosphatidylinositol alpha 1,6-mannosyltransferase
VVTEAQASGLPAVVPDRGGVVDTVVPCRTGFRFSPGDAASLARAVARLVDDPTLRSHMGRIARGDAEERGWAAVCASLVARYEALIALRAPRVLDRPRRERLVETTA